MRRMILLSVIFHGFLFVLVTVSTFAWQRRDVMPIIHQVELVSLPRGNVPQPKAVEAKMPERVWEKPPDEKKEAVEPPAKTRMVEPRRKKEVAVKEKIPKEAPESVKEPVAPPSADRLKEPGKPTEPQTSAALQTPGVPDVTVLQRPYSEYEFYHALIGREIRKRWSPPPVSLRGHRMETVVAFSISRSGRIDSPVTIERSSGSQFYDQAALRATMGPLPPPPPGYPEELLKMRLIYVLDQSHLN